MPFNVVGISEQILLHHLSSARSQAHPVTQGYPESQEVPLLLHYRDGTGYKDPKEKLDHLGPKEHPGIRGSREDGNNVFGTISTTRPIMDEF